MAAEVLSEQYPGNETRPELNPDVSESIISEIAFFPMQEGPRQTAKSVPHMIHQLATDPALVLAAADPTPFFGSSQFLDFLFLETS